MLNGPLNILSILLLTIFVIVLFLYFSTKMNFNMNFNLNSIINPTQNPSQIEQLEPKNPKEELVNYFALNWSRLAPILIKKDCEDDYVPQEIITEFSNKFGHYFKHQNEKIDPMLSHYSNGTFERTFKMEIKEICKTLNSLSDFINSKNNFLELNQLVKEIERLHTDHFPQAVFIAVILDRMLETFKKFPNYNISQISNTNDLLTISIISYLTSNYN